MEGTDAAIHEARCIAERAETPLFYADQYANPENWRAHYHGTAEELWRETRGEITHVVAGIGTSGTLVGTARRLRELNPEIVAVAVQPDGPAGLARAVSGGRADRPAGHGGNPRSRPARRRDSRR